jgi:hypothetical protein
MPSLNCALSSALYDILSCFAQSGYSTVARIEVIVRWSTGTDADQSDVQAGTETARILFDDEEACANKKYILLCATQPASGLIHERYKQDAKKDGRKAQRVPS